MHLRSTYDAALLSDLLAEHGSDLLVRLVHAGLLSDLAEQHDEAMAAEETRIVYAFDPADLDPNDLAEWFEGLSDSVLSRHFGDEFGS